MKTRTPAETTIQSFGHLAPARLGLSNEVRHKSVAALNRMLAHCLALRDLYKTSHWQTSGATFYQLHLLFDKHYEAQAELADAVAERVQTLGGIAAARAQDVHSETRISRSVRDRESVSAELARLLDAHEMVLLEARVLAREATERGDDGTNDLLVSQLVRTNEIQSWFIAEHMIPTDSAV